MESISIGAEESLDNSSQALLNYLTHLDFGLVTHAHIDYIGGIPQIAYHFVNKNTKFIFKKYRVNRENNKMYFNPAYNSMQIKGAQLIELANGKYEFDFGDTHFELINIYNQKHYSENYNSIGAIVTLKSKKNIPCS